MNGRGGFWSKFLLEQGQFSAFLAALLFGASTPFAKVLMEKIPPVLLAGVFYSGSGLGLFAIRFVRDRSFKPPGFSKGEWVWFLGAVLFGGVLGPVLLMLGLKSSSAANASLLLNLEGVFTAVLAWVIFKENADKRIVLGMFLIVGGGLLLSWPSDWSGKTSWVGPLLIAAACGCWGIDNNLTRKVSSNDALFIAGFKGLAAGGLNCVLASFLGQTFWEGQILAKAALVGFLGYGLSLVMFVLALRGLGASRTGAYFSTAPFIGAALSMVFLGEGSTPLFWLAGGLMALGVLLHLTEHHEHEHTHEALTHHHGHVHDEHHQHTHDFEWDGAEPHAHLHHHIPITHTHPHFPDIHHQHSH